MATQISDQKFADDGLEECPRSFYLKTSVEQSRIDCPSCGGDHLEVIETEPTNLVRCNECGVRWHECGAQNYTLVTLENYPYNCTACFKISTDKSKTFCPKCKSYRVHSCTCGPNHHTCVNCMFNWHKCKQKIVEIPAFSMIAKSHPAVCKKCNNKS